MDITDQLLLTAEEIYYLAKTNNGKFLDFDYISAMDNIGDNKSVFEEKCKRSLMGKKLIDEDFDGSMSMPLSVTALIEPIYNGDYESLLSFLDGTDKSFVARIHKKGEKYTLVSDTKGGFELKSIDEKTIETIVEKALKNYTEDEGVPATADKDSFNLVIIIKGIKPEETSIVYVFYGNGKGIYEESDDDSFKCIDKSSFLKKTVDILKGCENGF